MLKPEAMRENAPRIVDVFSQIARPIMRQFMDASSCIASARCTIEVMKLFQLRSQEIPVAFALQVPARKYARISGWTEEQRAEMRKTAASYQDLPIKGWNGHLLVLVENRWVIDPSIDQADAPEFGVSIPPEVFTFSTQGNKWNPFDQFEMQLGLTLDNGDQASLMYRRIENTEYLETEAWNDEGLPALAKAIAVQMAIKEMGDKVRFV